MSQNDYGGKVHIEYGQGHSVPAKPDQNRLKCRDAIRRQLHDYSNDQLLAYAQGIRDELKPATNPGQRSHRSLDRWYYVELEFVSRGLTCPK